MDIRDLYSIRSSFSKARAYFVDWDGTLFTEGVPVPGALDFLRSHSSRVVVLSNNSTDRPDDIAAILERHGVSLASDRVLLAGHQTLVSVAASQSVKRIALVGVAAMHSVAKGLGFEITWEKPEALLIMRDTAFSYEILTRAMNLLRQGCDCIAANGDITHPGPSNTVLPETGALLAAVLSGLRCHQPVVSGKPSINLFRLGLGLCNMSPGDVVMIGDNAETDGAGATAAGLSFIHLAPGRGLEWSDLID